MPESFAGEDRTLSKEDTQLRYVIVALFVIVGLLIFYTPGRLGMTSTTTTVSTTTSSTTTSTSSSIGTSPLYVSVEFCVNENTADCATVQNETVTLCIQGQSTCLNAFTVLNGNSDRATFFIALGVTVTATAAPTQGVLFSTGNTIQFNTPGTTIALEHDAPPPP